MAPTDSDDALETPAATRLEFVQYHQPPLKGGDYQVTVTQTVTIRGEAKPSFNTSRKFAVQGIRCVLDPSVVYAVFPPEGSLGDHSNVLPHVVLNRSTLPWERRPHPDRADLPWLALLLFDDAEKPEPTTVALGNLYTSTSTSPWWPGLPAEIGEDPTVKVTIIDVKKGLLRSLLPTAADLSFTAHVRRGLDDQGRPVGDEQSVVIGGRLPAAGATSTVHLVSLDSRFRGNVQANPPYSFDFSQAADADLIRLVSLKSWNFTCADPKQQFKHLLLNLDPYLDGQPTGRPAAFRPPPVNNPQADTYLSLGYVPLPHAMREGSRTISWYHGPLIPFNNADSVTLPARAGDELLRYDPSTGLFDVSYAAAWELGRLLTLRSKQVSTSLYAWKRARAQQLVPAEQHVLHLPFAPKEQATDDLENIVDGWFDGLNRLQGVPYNYLVPDERMLPPESIRFFHIDSAWIDCLLDGAFSIGRVTTADLDREGRFTDSPASAGSGKLAGFLLRSDLVSGWPGLQVNAKVAGVTPEVMPIRTDRLGPNVLICLFSGDILSVSIHLKPETLHFGLDHSVIAPETLTKKLRDATGRIPESGGLTIGDVPMRDRGRRMLNMNGLAGVISRTLADAQVIPPDRASTSASFAFHMVEGVDTVIFEVSSGG